MVKTGNGLSWDLEVTMRMSPLCPRSIVLGVTHREWSPLKTATKEVRSSGKNSVSIKRGGNSNM